MTANSVSRTKPSAQIKTTRSPKRRQQRARGRPRDNGASVGADAIVIEVCDLLRKVTPRDVTLLRVAQHAGVDRSLIRYYFKNRSSLLLAAARHLFAQLQSELAGLQSISPEDPEARIRESARALLRFQIKHPYFHRLMVDEVVNSEHPDALAFFKSFTGAGVRNHRGIADSIAQHTGMREVDGAFLYMALIGMCEFFVTGAPILKVAFGRDYDVAAVSRQYETFLVDYVVDGLHRRRG